MGLTRGGSVLISRAHGATLVAEAAPAVALTVCICMAQSDIVAVCQYGACSQLCMLCGHNYYAAYC